MSPPCVLYRSTHHRQHGSDNLGVKSLYLTRACLLSRCLQQCTHWGQKAHAKAWRAALGVAVALRPLTGVHKRGSTCKYDCSHAEESAPSSIVFLTTRRLAALTICGTLCELHFKTVTTQARQCSSPSACKQAAVMRKWLGSTPTLYRQCREAVCWRASRCLYPPSRPGSRYESPTSSARLCVMYALVHPVPS